MYRQERPFAPVDQADRPFAMAVYSVPGVGSARARRVQQELGSFRAAWRASDAQLAAIGLPKMVTSSLKEARDSCSPCGLPDLLTRCGVRAVFYGDADYPAGLGHIPGPPLVLYVRGSLEPADLAACAIVGTRRASPYGRWMAQKLGAGLARAGLAVISGLAVGVDSAAHQAAVDAGGRTLAVLGGGLDAVYPVQSERLAESILDAGGALLSEYLPGTPTVAGNFLARNRLISGLALATVIVEAGVRSGALGTARHALEQGREVCGVPGRVGDPGSAGVHRLLRDGAHLVESVADILQIIGPHAAAALHMAATMADDGAGDPEPSGRDQRSLSHRLLRILACGPLAEAALVAKSAGGAAGVRAALALLELDGLVQRLPGGVYVALDSSPKVKQS